METVTINNVAELDALAETVLAHARATASLQATVIALSGDLGAWKTALVQAVARRLGITEPVTSPTFIILKQYETTDTTWSTLLHMDAYRLESLDELNPLAFTELLAQPAKLFCIEWAEKILAALPTSTIKVHLAITEDPVRIAQIS